MKSYEEVAKLFATAKRPELGKPVENNTRIFKVGETYALRHHNTDIVIWRADGSYAVDTSYVLNCTLDRIRRWTNLRPYRYRWPAINGFRPLNDCDTWAVRVGKDLIRYRGNSGAGDLLRFTADGEVELDSIESVDVALISKPRTWRSAYTRMRLNMPALRVAARVEGRNLGNTGIYSVANWVARHLGYPAPPAELGSLLSLDTLSTSPYFREAFASALGVLERKEFKLLP